MRVIAGEFRGRRLQGPPDSRTRPTSDRIRESMMNALVSRDALDGARVADLFSGTGALAIEALSRGATRATAVESDRRMVEIIKSNAGSLGVDDRLMVVPGPVETFVRRSGGQYDLAFCDPPYDYDNWPVLLDALHESMAPTLLVLESRVEIEPHSGWSIIRERRYGSTIVTIAERVGIAPSRARSTS